MPKVLVTGSSGQVGSELRALCTNYKNYEFIFTDRTVLDLSNLQSITTYLQNNKFDIIINCAAYTAVDKAESEQDLADVINHQAVAVLAQIAKDRKITLIHISTDYVFDGKSLTPYLESDRTNPINVYGKTKRKGEEAILRISPMNSIIIRTSWIYSRYGNNFVKTMLKLGSERDSVDVVADQVGSPTCARDLANVILDILPIVKNPSPEIYHYSNEGVTSWYEFAQTIFELSKLKCNARAITTENYPTPATRPRFSVLDKNKVINDFKFTIPTWKESLIKYLGVI